MVKLLMNRSGMPYERRTFRRFVLWFGIPLCLVYFLWNNNPLPLKDGTLSKREAAEAAAAHFGLDLSRVKYAVTYEVDKAIIAYLQKEKLLSEYAERYDPAYPLDYYRVELELTDGEKTHRYAAHVHRYEGIVSGWSVQSDPPPKTAGQGDETAARRTADDYLRTQRPGDLREASVSVRPLTDGSFLVSYGQRDDRIGEAYRTAAVRVAGGQAVSYRSTFVPPESFMEWLTEQDRRSGWFIRISLWISVLMAAAGAVVAIMHHRTIRWTDGFILIGAVIVIEAIHYMNTLPNYVPPIELTDLSAGMLAFELAFGLIVTAVFRTTVLMSYLGGKVLWQRDGMRRPLAPATPEEWRSSAAQGYGFAIFILALQTLIFTIAESSFYVWWIPDPELSTDNMLWPLLMPLTAWAAAITEEIVYRLFAVSILRKLLRSTFPAVLISSMIWALGHTSYPVYPVYTRFVEVTVIGIVFGYIFIKFGFAAAVFAHAVVDSVLMGFEVASAGPIGVAAALFYIALPWFVAQLFARLGTPRPTATGIGPPVLRFD